jgi:hypothetical protein
LRAFYQQGFIPKKNRNARYFVQFNENGEPVKGTQGLKAVILNINSKQSLKASVESIAQFGNENNNEPHRRHSYYYLQLDPSDIATPHPQVKSWSLHNTKSAAMYRFRELYNTATRTYGLHLCRASTNQIRQHLTATQVNVECSLPVCLVSLTTWRKDVVWALEGLLVVR